MQKYYLFLLLLIKLVCDDNCETCTDSATVCATCKTGWKVEAAKCVVIPVPPTPPAKNKTNGTTPGTDSKGSEESSILKFVIIGAVVVLVLVVVGGAVFYCM